MKKLLFVCSLLAFAVSCTKDTKPSPTPSNCTTLSATISSPANADSVAGTRTTRADGTQGLTFAMDISVCIPQSSADQKVSAVEVIASTLDSNIVRKVGNAAVVSSSSGTYRLSAGVGAAGNVGQWLPTTATEAGPLDPNTYRFWVRVYTNNGHLATQSPTITLTLKNPK